MGASIEKTTQDFFNKLWVEYTDLKITEESEKIFRVVLQTPDSHILIGPHGKNLETLTYLLKLIASRQHGSHITLHLEVNDYLQKKDEKLLIFIQNKIDFVQQSGKEITLPFLSSYERKKVHSYVHENSKSVYTQSVWEWENRRMHLLKKDISLDIDIDGDDI